MELPRLSSLHSLQNSGQTQNRPCPETAWHTGPLQVARSFWLTQSGLCTPKVIEMVWITVSTTQRNQLTWRWTLQCWNLPCYAEIGWLVSFYQPEKLLQSTFSTQTTKNKTTKNILERNKIALMTSKDAALVCIQINTLPRVHRIKALNFATTFFRSGAWRTGEVQIPQEDGWGGYWWRNFYQKIPQIEVKTMTTKLVLLGHMWLWFPLRPAIYGLLLRPFWCYLIL